MLPKNREQALKRAAEDTRKKIKLEPFLEVEMRRIFKQITQDFRLKYPVHKEVLNVNDYESDVIAALRKHYLRVSKVFSDNLQTEIKNNIKTRIKSDITDEVDRSMFKYIIEHSKTQARFILKTTQSELEKKIASVVNEAVLSGKPLNSKQIADIVSRDFLKRISGRVKTISLTETQNIAEKTKYTEAKEVEKNVLTNQEQYQETVGKPVLEKQWIAILDDVTREWHADADGQTVKLDNLFLVMDEYLLYPGDPSGSPANIINCRCSVVYT